MPFDLGEVLRFFITFVPLGRWWPLVAVAIATPGQSTRRCLRRIYVLAVPLVLEWAFQTAEQQ